MSVAKSDNIDEKIVPYVEGVLNEKEERSVSHALSADPETARAAQDVKEAIRSLKGAFEAGVRPSYEASMTEAEIVKFACEADTLEPAERRRLGLLFAESKLAQSEYDLLQELDAELESKVETPAEIPPMSAALKKEFSQLYAPTSSSGESAGLWVRLTAWLGELNPRPFVAVATCLVAVTLGILYYNPNGETTATSNVAMREAESTPGFGAAPEAVAEDGLQEEESEVAVDEVTTDGDKAGKNSEESVLVSDSLDSSQLREQARKLLDSEVRYTVRGQSIYVDKDQLDKANKVLGKKIEAKPGSDRKLAMVEKVGQSKEELDQPGEEKSLKPAKPPEPAEPRVVTIQARPKPQNEEQPEPARPARVAKRSPVTPPSPPQSITGAAPASAANGRTESEAGEQLLKSRRGMSGAGATMKQPVTSDNRQEVPEAYRPKAIQIPKTEWQRADAVPVPASTGVSQLEVKLDNNKGARSKDASSSGAEGAERDGWTHPAPGGSNKKAKSPADDGSFQVAAGQTGVATNVAIEERTQVPPSRSRQSYSTQRSAPAVPDMEVALARKAQAVANEFNAVASVETRDEGGRAVYVRLNEPLDEAGVERLRTALRQRLGLDDTDTIIIRQP